MLRLWYAVTDSFSSLNYTKDELIDDIYAVLNEWGYQVTEETDDQVAFIRNDKINNARTPSAASRNYDFFTHKGKVEISTKGAKTELTLHFSITYWAELAIPIFAGIISFIARDTSVLIFMGLFPIPISILRYFFFSRRCKEMLADIINI